MLRTGRLPAPHRGRSSPASTPGSRPTPGVLLPGTLASPRTGLTPAGCRELVARLRRGALLSVVLGARATGRTSRPNPPAQAAVCDAAARQADQGWCATMEAALAVRVRQRAWRRAEGASWRARLAPSGRPRYAVSAPQ